jgi:hypothetical protein
MNQPFTLSINGEAILAAEGLTLQVLSVEDSRCPKGANCVVIGEAKVKLALSRAGKALGTLELIIPAHPKTTYLGGYYLRLLDVLPYPDTNTVSKPAKTVRLEVQKTPFR